MAAGCRAAGSRRSPCSATTITMQAARTTDGDARGRRRDRSGRRRTHPAGRRGRGGRRGDDRRLRRLLRRTARRAGRGRAAARAERAQAHAASLSDALAGIAGCAVRPSSCTTRRPRRRSGASAAACGAGSGASGSPPDPGAPPRRRRSRARARRRVPRGPGRRAGVQRLGRGRRPRAAATSSCTPPREGRDATPSAAVSWAFGGRCAHIQLGRHASRQRRALCRHRCGRLEPRPRPGPPRCRRPPRRRRPPATPASCTSPRANGCTCARRRSRTPISSAASRSAARRVCGLGRARGAPGVHPRGRDGRPADEVRARDAGGALPVARRGPRPGALGRDAGGRGAPHRRAPRVRRGRHRRC